MSEPICKNFLIRRSISNAHYWNC